MRFRCAARGRHRARCPRRLETDGTPARACVRRVRVRAPNALPPVVYRGFILVGGRVWGEDCIMSRVDVRSRPARALAYVLVSLINGEELTDIVYTSVTAYDRKGNPTQAPLYPLAVKRMRWERVRLALLAAAAKQRKLNAAAAGGAKRGVWDAALNQMEVDLEKVTAEADEKLRSPLSRLAAPFGRKKEKEPSPSAQRAAPANGSAAAQVSAQVPGAEV